MPLQPNCEAPSLPPQLLAVFAGNIDGRAMNVIYRQKQMHRLHACIAEHLEEIRTSIAQDYGHRVTETQAEIALALQEIHVHYASLDQKHDLEREYRIAHGQDQWHGMRAAGIVYIIPTTHTLFYSVVAALAASLVAGNCTVLELPPAPSQTSSLLRTLLTDALDSDTFAICTERPSPEYLCNMHVVAQSSVDDLTADCLHVVSPCHQRTAAIVDRTANVEAAAADLVIARLAFDGRSPYDPDVILVNEFCFGRFIEAVVKHGAQYMGHASHCPTEAMNDRHRKSRSLLDDLTDEDGAQAIISGHDWGVVQIGSR